MLACVTRHWLRDDDWLYLYGWWPDDQKPPVVLFSVAGFDELKPEGRTPIARSPTPWCPASPASTDVRTHSRGAKDCPMAFNEKRAFSHLVGLQKFDANCRKKLSGKLGGKLAALDALLKVFARRSALVGSNA